jgi:hypothetical protein
VEAAEEGGIETMTPDNKPPLGLPVLALVFFSFYLAILMLIAGAIIGITSSVVGQSALNAAMFPYMMVLVTAVIGSDLALFFTKKKSPVMILTLAPIVVVYAVLSQALPWHSWFLLISRELNEVLHIVSRISHIRFA